MANETMRWRFEDASLHMPGSHQAQQEAQLSDPRSLSALYRQAQPPDFSNYMFKTPVPER